LDRSDDFQTCLGLVLSCQTSRDEIILDYQAGFAGLIARHDVWLGVLEDQLGRCPSAQITYGESVREVIIDRNRAEGVRMRSGENRRADLTVVAAGRNARLATAARIPLTRQTRSRSLVLSLRGVALPHPERGHVFLGGPGPVLAYPIGSDCVRMCISLPPAQLEQEGEIDVRSAFAPHLPASLAAALAHQDWPSSARQYPNVSMRLSRRWPRSLAFVGDAATCSHPLTASGITRAFLQAEITAQYARSCQSHLRPRMLNASKTARGAAIADALERVCAEPSPTGPVLRAGLFCYLRSSRRRRAALRLATGQTLSATTAAREYGSLMLHTIRPLVLNYGHSSTVRRLVVRDMLRNATRTLSELARR
jgi:2-polyprenyl-6-methoxyphenol hydroxylase-like FAD-dependent oxidoreductase